MLKLLKYLKTKELLLALVCVALVTLQVFLDLQLIDYVSNITRLVLTDGSTLDQVWGEGIKMVGCAFGSLLAAFITGFFAARIATRFAQRIREAVFVQVQSYSMEEINRFSTASLITRSTNDVTQVQMLLTMGLQLMIKAPIMAVWAVLKIYSKGLEWSLATMAAVGGLMIMVLIVTIFVFPNFRKMQSLTDNLTKVTRENLQGVRVIRAYNAEHYQQRKLGRANDELNSTILSTTRTMAIMMPLLVLIQVGLSLAIYWIGAYLIDGAELAQRIELFSNMAVFGSYAMMVIMAFILLVMIFIMFPRANVSANRIAEVLNTKSTIVDGDTVTANTSHGRIVFDQVSFKYPDAAEYVLEDISFTVEPGQTVAFIGSTGSGKSTLINLIVRFFDVTQGRIIIDDVEIKDYRLEELYNKIGYIPQKAVMFKGTVASNVAYGEGANEFSRAEIERAVAIAQARDFVEALEEGYDSPIAQGGTNISGGQRQRLAIARAVVRRPDIFIFDDSFSALDYQTDRLLRQALKKETRETTNLIVAQRIGTIIEADKIIVLHEGRIVGDGTHQELLKSCRVYQEIALSQLSAEELEHGQA